MVRFLQIVVGLLCVNAMWGRAVYFKLRDTHTHDWNVDTDGRVQMLRASRLASQAEVVDTLRTHGASVRQYWISNVVRAELRAGVYAVVDAVLARHGAEVLDVFDEREYNVSVPIRGVEYTDVQSVSWGVSHIGAPAMWARGITGRGVVIANIDTGVRYTHELLKNAYRGASRERESGDIHDYNWFDPYNGSTYPNDGNGHGTHVMGVSIEVAPDAQWIAARGCGRLTCTTRGLLESAEYLLCPTRLDGSESDCALRPHVINNSWGGGQGDAWFDDVIDAWVRAGIVPVFAAGNSGPGCGTVNSPSDSVRDVLSVCATDKTDAIASFSSRGPARTALDKPDVCAPGVDVRSAWYDGDTSYMTISGTSMASPHVSGAIALLLQEDMSLRFDQVRLRDVVRALVTQRVAPTDGACGPSQTFPNTYYGYGRLQLQ